MYSVLFKKLNTPEESANIAVLKENGYDIQEKDDLFVFTGSLFSCHQAIQVFGPGIIAY